METIIADLVNRFEGGRLTRRQLIQGLSMLMATGSSAASAAQAAGLRGTGIDHVSILVEDLQRSATFYQTCSG